MESKRDKSRLEEVTRVFTQVEAEVDGLDNKAWRYDEVDFKQLFSDLFYGIQEALK